MRVVVQRVSSAAVVVEGETVGAIGPGLLLLCGIHGTDGPTELKWMADKVVNLRIFEDDDGKMNLSVLDVGGGVLAVSQFTLYGDCRRGRRPSFIEAAPPEQADRLYKDFVSLLKERVEHVEQGTFQAHMDVSLINDGPVTLILDSVVR
ncbi:D-tyrosyl-tRNA(Tyr) deacylase [bacterium CPR1]|nr:D-tyrosyl-tRNA(Tyr) deacylase [bacterium CPR1]